MKEIKEARGQFVATLLDTWTRFACALVASKTGSYDVSEVARDADRMLEEWESRVKAAGEELLKLESAEKPTPRGSGCSPEEEKP